MGRLALRQPEYRPAGQTDLELSVPLAEVHRDYGGSEVFLDVDGLPLPAATSWRDMTGMAAEALGEPAEARHSNSGPWTGESSGPAP